MVSETGYVSILERRREVNRLTITRRKAAVLILAALMTAGAVFAGSTVSNTPVTDAYAKAGEPNETP